MQSRHHHLILYFSVFISGVATMGVEMCASRLLAPYFGNSLPVWGLLIGLLLTCLALGYLWGGRLADRYPRANLLYKLTAWTGFSIGLIPYIAHPILRHSLVGFASYQAGVVLSCLLSASALFALPVLLLGCTLPFAIRLSVENTASSGDIVGRIYALSTLGNLTGTFTSVFLLIPNLGTRRTIFIISLSLLVAAVIGLLKTSGRRALLYVLLLAFIIMLQIFLPRTIKPTPGMIYEVESAYNYIQVLAKGDEVILKLNEGEGIQSSYHPQQLLTGYVYDYFLLVPFFRSELPSPLVAHLCLIGLAGGTIAHQYNAVFKSPLIDGIEIDPAVVDVGRRFFALDLPNLRITVEDGRYYLAHSTQLYDIILIDAYCPPYIPFQLTTVEFFRLVRDHLTPDGVVAINVARTETDYSLVNAIASTLKAVYSKVYVVDTLSNLNSIVIASRKSSELPVITARLYSLSDPILKNVVSRTKGRIREFVTPNTEILRDDHAPVEQIVHVIMTRYLLGHTVQEMHP